MKTRTSHAFTTQPRRFTFTEKKMTKYPVPDNFFPNTARHCVGIFIHEPKIGVEPNENDLNATLTFVKFNGKTYGITCKHVTEKENRPSFVTLTQGKQCIINDFICPQGDIFVYPAPDIAIRQIHPNFPQAIGKIPIKVEQNNIPALNTIRHSVAVGFPTKEKQKFAVQNGNRIEMPCVHALAEISSINKSNGQLSLHSELEQNVQIKDFNGMSGGPVFWSTEKEYGLLGITYAALLPNPSENSLGGGPRIAIKSELVTPERFKNWLTQFPVLTEDKNWVNNIKLDIHIAQ